MDYSTFKALQALLFFGSVFAFCFWQIGALKRLRRERVRAEARRRVAGKQRRPVR